MDVIRDLLNTYQSVTSKKWNHLSRQVWGSVAVALASIFRDSNNDLPTSQFIGQAVEPTPGGSGSVDLDKGLALYFDSTVSDKWAGELRPIWLEEVKNVDIGTNNDASGDDRIDLICVRPVVTEQDEESIKVKDPDTGDISTKNLPQTKRYDWEYQVLEGTPAANPSAPTTPSGWIAVAEVTRPNGQADVNSGDINDVRTPAEIKVDQIVGDAIDASTVEADTITAVQKYLFGDTSGQHFRLDEDSGEPNLARLTELASDGTPTGDYAGFRAPAGYYFGESGISDHLKLVPNAPGAPTWLELLDEAGNYQMLQLSQINAQDLNPVAISELSALGPNRGIHVADTNNSNYPSHQTLLVGTASDGLAEGNWAMLNAYIEDVIHGDTIDTGASNTLSVSDENDERVQIPSENSAVVWGNYTYDLSTQTFVEDVKVDDGVNLSFAETDDANPDVIIKFDIDAPPSGQTYAAHCELQNQPGDDSPLISHAFYNSSDDQIHIRCWDMTGAGADSEEPGDNADLYLEVKQAPTT